MIASFLKNLFQKMVRLREYGDSLPLPIGQRYFVSLIYKPDLIIPEKATLMSVEFTFVRSTGGEKFGVILGTGGKEVYSVGAGDLEDNAFKTSNLIDVSNYSGKKTLVSLRFYGDEDINGKDGGGSLILKNIKFYKSKA